MTGVGKDAVGGLIQDNRAGGRSSCLSLPYADQARLLLAEPFSRMHGHLAAVCVFAPVLLAWVLTRVRAARAEAADTNA